MQHGAISVHDMIFFGVKTFKILLIIIVGNFNCVPLFLPCDAMLARYTLSSCVCLSVYPSVTSRYCVKIAKHRITKTSLHDRPGTLVF